MGKKTCKVCGKTKNADKEFYKSSGKTCAACKNKQTQEHAKESRQNQHHLLQELHGNQQGIIQHMVEMTEKMGEITLQLNTVTKKLVDMEDEIGKLRRTLKKMTK
jgi:chromosome segregation ATPase